MDQFTAQLRPAAIQSSFDLRLHAPQSDRPLKEPVMISHLEGPRHRLA